MAGGDDDVKRTSRDALYTCLDVALRLIHPMMPFLSEELFQRLPRRTPNEPPSICVTSYPLTETFDRFRNEGSFLKRFQINNQIVLTEIDMFCYVFAAVERDVEFALGFVKSVRSMRADYQLTPKMKTECRMAKPRRRSHISPVTYDVFVSLSCSVCAM